MPGLDPGFISLPYRALGDAALQRAHDLGASHADFRFERVRWQDVRVRDGALQGAADDEDLGFAVRVIHGGAWGFASGVSPHRGRGGRGSPSRRSRSPRSSAALTSGPGRDRPGAGVRRRHLGLVVRASTRSRSPSHEKTARAARLDRAPACATRGRSTRRPSCCRSTRTSTTPTSPAPVRRSSGSGCCPTFTAMGADDQRGIFDDMSSIAPPAGRGWEYVVGHRRRRVGLGRRARRGAGAARREAGRPERRGRHLRPGHPPVATSG